jgi:hypothetical protein
MQKGDKFQKYQKYVMYNMYFVVFFVLLVRCYQIYLQKVILYVYTSIWRILILVFYSQRQNFFRAGRKILNRVGNTESDGAFFA